MTRENGAQAARRHVRSADANGPRKRVLLPSREPQGHRETPGGGVKAEGPSEGKPCRQSIFRMPDSKN
jgi:hypothetical protein